MSPIAEFLRAIPLAAKSPIAFGAYTIAAVLMIYGGFRQLQLRTVVSLQKSSKATGKALKEIIESVTNSKLPEKISGEEWIRNNSNNGILIFALSLLLVVFVVLLVALAKPKAASQATPSQTAQTTGNNSPAIQAGNGSTVNVHYGVWSEVFDELDRRRDAKDAEATTSHTFSILREKGATIALGPCPGKKCFTFELGETRLQDDKLVQDIFLGGAGFEPGPREELARFAGETNLATLPQLLTNQLIIATGEGTTITGAKHPSMVSLPIDRRSYVEFSTPVAFIRLDVLDTRAESMRIKLEVRRPMPPKL